MTEVIEVIDEAAREAREKFGLEVIHYEIIDPDMVKFNIRGEPSRVSLAAEFLREKLQSSTLRFHVIW